MDLPRVQTKSSFLVWTLCLVGTVPSSTSVSLSPRHHAVFSPTQARQVAHRYRPIGKTAHDQTTLLYGDFLKQLSEEGSMCVVSCGARSDEAVHLALSVVRHHTLRATIGGPHCPVDEVHRELWTWYGKRFDQNLSVVSG